MKYIKNIKNNNKKEASTVTRSCPGVAWDHKPAPSSGDSLAEATMGQSPFFVHLPSLIKLAGGVIGF